MIQRPYYDQRKGKIREGIAYPQYSIPLWTFPSIPLLQSSCIEGSSCTTSIYLCNPNLFHTACSEGTYFQRVSIPYLLLTESLSIDVFRILYVDKRCQARFKLKNASSVTMISPFQMEKGPFVEASPSIPRVSAALAAIVCMRFSRRLNDECQSMQLSRAESICMRLFVQFVVKVLATMIYAMVQAHVLNVGEK